MEYSPISKDKRRRKDLRRLQRTNGNNPNPASFTEFMGNFYNHDKDEIQLAQFIVPGELKGELVASIRRANINKAPGRDGIHNEMLKVEAKLMADLLWEVWRLIGRTSVYA